MPYAVYHAGVIEVSSGFETRREAREWIEESKQRPYYKGLRLGIKVGEHANDGDNEDEEDSFWINNKIDEMHGK